MCFPEMTLIGRAELNHFGGNVPDHEPSLMFGASVNTPDHYSFLSFFPKSSLKACIEMQISHESRLNELSRTVDHKGTISVRC